MRENINEEFDNKKEYDLPKLDISPQNFETVKIFIKNNNITPEDFLYLSATVGVNTKNADIYQDKIQILRADLFEYYLKKARKSEDRESIDTISFTKILGEIDISNEQKLKLIKNYCVKHRLEECKINELFEYCADINLINPFEELKLLNKIYKKLNIIPNSLAEADTAVVNATSSTIQNPKQLSLT